MLDLLSDILTKLSVQGALYFRTSLTTPWGIEVPKFNNVARFHFAHRGNCLIEVEGYEKVVGLEQGDLLIVPHGASHKLYCAAETRDAVLPLDTVIERSGYTGTGVLVYGGDGDERDTQLICGHFSFDPHAKHILLERLPPIIHLRNYGESAGKWMEATLRMIGDEAGGLRLGGDLIALKMSEAILAQAIRSFVESDESSRWGLNGFSDHHLARALDAFHKDPSASWTIETMARIAGMSRTNFAVQFQKKMAMSPMQYVTAWRLEIAKRCLTDPSSSVSDAAERAGYASDSAFARVFKREIGLSPAGFRRQITLSSAQ
ncbi:AraC family transcriptional regulator [Ruegeria faecimaris]|uniref:AraC-type DNA-binding protein n=1 Tax=Ruegeria faecimaris TaxID=686389 RepID=A0A521DPW7_9RHOB|nr:AraC family transcriptional regulator [Ruegeria faecimaris]SMO73151.1 AraC-type DNA-binding protein [Ruegeria faecimaris]